MQSFSFRRPLNSIRFPTNGWTSGASGVLVIFGTWVWVACFCKGFSEALMGELENGYIENPDYQDQHDSNRPR